MKRLVRIAPVLVAFFAFGSATAAPSGYRLFTSPLDHYQVYYPASWSAQTRSGVQYFIGPKLGGFWTNVNIFAGTTSQPLNSLGPLAVKALKKQGATDISSGRTHVAGSSAWYISGLFTRGNDRFAQVIFAGRKLAWEITYSSSPRAFNVVTFRTVYSTFAWTR